MVVLKYKHRDLCGLLILRLDNHFYAGLSGRNLSAAHGMAGIHRIARQNRNVVMLGRIQTNLTRIYFRFGGGPGAAGAITDVAHCWCTQKGLAGLARNCSYAALCHDRHVAGVEVRSIDRRSTLWSNSRATRREWIRLAIGVNEEGAVFL